MRIRGSAFAHPTQASRVRLTLYEVDAETNRSPAQGPGPRCRYLVTEERQGAVTVVATLGGFDALDAAIARLEARERELRQQRYRQVEPAA